MFETTVQMRFDSILPESVSERLFQMAQDSKHKIKSCIVTDQEALQSCFNFASDHRMLVGLHSIFLHR